MMMNGDVNKARLAGEHLASSHFAQLGQWRLHCFAANPSISSPLYFLSISIFLRNWVNGGFTANPSIPSPLYFLSISIFLRNWVNAMATSLAH